MNIKTLTSGAIAASIIAASAWAHGGASGIVKERMDAMSSMGDGVKRLVPMMRGKAPYDAAVVKAVAAQIEGHAGETLTKLFPGGSGGGHSEAKAEIWDDWDGFSALAQQLQHLAKGLALAAENDKVGGGGASGGMMGGGAMRVPDLAHLAQMPVQGVFALVGKTCSACHSKFRAKK